MGRASGAEPSREAVPPALQCLCSANIIGLGAFHWRSSHSLGLLTEKALWQAAALVDGTQMPKTLEIDKVQHVLEQWTRRLSADDTLKLSTHSTYLGGGIHSCMHACTTRLYLVAVSVGFSPKPSAATSLVPVVSSLHFTFCCAACRHSTLPSAASLRAVLTRPHVTRQHLPFDSHLTKRRSLLILPGLPTSTSFTPTLAVTRGFLLFRPTLLSLLLPLYACSVAPHHHTTCRSLLTTILFSDYLCYLNWCRLVIDRLSEPCTKSVLTQSFSAP